MRLVTLMGLGISATLLAGCLGSVPSADAGRELYAENGCASCHGSAGHGDGPSAATLPARPIDFRDVSQFKHGSTEAAIAQTLAEGVSIVHTLPQLHATHHLLLMPKFDHLTKTERRSIALYVISMRAAATQGRIQP